MTHQDSRGTVCECFKGINTENWPSAQLVGLWILDDTGMNNEFLMVILTQKLNSINCAFSDKHQICLSVQGYHSFLSQICFNHTNLASSCFLLVHIHDENNSFSECEIMLRLFTHNESSCLVSSKHDAGVCHPSQGISRCWCWCCQRTEGKAFCCLFPRCLWSFIRPRGIVILFLSMLVSTWRTIRAPWLRLWPGYSANKPALLNKTSVLWLGCAVSIVSQRVIAPCRS